jgi:hypothetical protein
MGMEVFPVGYSAKNTFAGNHCCHFYSQGETVIRNLKGGTGAGQNIGRTKRTYGCAELTT